MHIVYLSNSLVPSQKANSIQVMRMCEGFACNGHRVTLVCRPGRSFLSDSVFAFYGIQKSFALKYFSWSTGPLGGLVYGLRVGQYLRSLRDTVDLAYARCLYSSLAATLLGVPLIYEVHALPRTRYHRSLESVVLRSRALRRLVVISHQLRKDYENSLPWLRGRKIMKVAHDGGTASKDVPVDTSTSSPERVQVVYTGSLLPGKGVDIVVRLASRLTECDFHVLGGPEEAWSRYAHQHGNANLEYHGFQPPSMIGSWQRQADILLLPNQPRVLTNQGRVDIGRWTSPLKLFEYMAAGRAIVASDLPVLREILSNGRNALLVSPHSVDEWAAAIMTLADDAALRNRLGSQAREEMRCLYTWQERARRVLVA